MRKIAASPAGSEPLDTIVFTAGLTIARKPGFLFFIFLPPKSPARSGLIRHADLMDKPHGTNGGKTNRKALPIKGLS